MLREKLETINIVSQKIKFHIFQKFHISIEFNEKIKLYDF